MENTAENSLYNLSIRINTDGFSLSVSEQSGQQLSSKKVSLSILSLSTSEITNTLSTETELNYQNIRIIYESDIYIFIPAPLFKPEESARFLSLQHKLQKKECIIHNTIPNWNTVNAFSIPENLQQAIEELFPGLIIEHQMSYLLSEKVKQLPANSIHIWVRTNMLDVIVVQSSKLQLLNSFPYKTPEDFTYHTLNIMEQLAFDTKSSIVYLYNTEKKPEFATLLNNYVIVDKQ